MKNRENDVQTENADGAVMPLAQPSGDCRDCWQVLDRFQWAAATPAVDTLYSVTKIAGRSRVKGQGLVPGTETTSPPALSFGKEREPEIRSKPS